MALVLQSGLKFGSLNGGGDTPTPPTPKYQLLQRISDDSGTDIGIITGFYYDGLTTYAVVCLNRMYRSTTVLQYSEHDAATPSLKDWSTLSMWDVDTMPHETGTIATDCILADTGYASPACTHCRSFSFIIEGTRYYGQLPNIMEALSMFQHRTYVNNNDPSTGGKALTNNNSWMSSSQRTGKYYWNMYSTGSIYGNNSKATTSTSAMSYVAPILELPVPAN